MTKLVYPNRNTNCLIGQKKWHDYKACILHIDIKIVSHGFVLRAQEKYKHTKKSFCLYKEKTIIITFHLFLSLTM